MPIARSPGLAAASRQLSWQYNSKMVAGLRVPLSFLSPVSPVLLVITAPPGLRRGLLDKPPIAKVYCLFRFPAPFPRLSPPRRHLSSIPCRRFGCIELFENRPKLREITWENGYVVRLADKFDARDSKRTPRSSLYSREFSSNAPQGDTVERYPPRVHI